MSARTNIATAEIRATLCELLEQVRLEIEGWELEPAKEGEAPSDPATVRYGLYLIALDILLRESNKTSECEFYKKLPDAVKLSASDYAAFKKQLSPFIVILSALNIERLMKLEAQGLNETQAIETIDNSDEAVFEEWLGEAAPLPTVEI